MLITLLGKPVLEQYYERCDSRREMPWIAQGGRSMEKYCPLEVSPHCAHETLFVVDCEARWYV